jgi:hypothetical protein
MSRSSSRQGAPLLLRNFHLLREVLGVAMSILVAFFLWAVLLQNWTYDQLTRSSSTAGARDRARENEGPEHEEAR